MSGYADRPRDTHTGDGIPDPSIGKHRKGSPHAGGGSLKLRISRRREISFAPRGRGMRARLIYRCVTINVRPTRAGDRPGTHKLPARPPIFRKRAVAVAVKAARLRACILALTAASGQLAWEGGCARRQRVRVARFGNLPVRVRSCTIGA